MLKKIIEYDKEQKENKVREYNKRGNLIYSKNSYGFEWWRKYDKNDNLIHYKDSDGFESQNEYDENGNCIHTKHSNGYEYWKDYDENSRCIHHKDSSGYEEWDEFDNQGKHIHHKNSYGYEWWRKYDSNGKLIHYKDSSGDCIFYEYDNKNRLIKEDINGFIKNYEYYGEEEIIKSKDYEEWKEWLDKWNLKYKETDTPEYNIKEIIIYNGFSTIEVQFNFNGKFIGLTSYEDGDE